MNKYIKSLSLFLLLVIFLCGCHDAREVDDRTYVIAVGIDRGVLDKWRLTLQFHTMKVGSGEGEGTGEGGSEDDYTYVTVDSPSFFAGIDMLNSSLPRELSFTHTSLFVVSKDLAQSGNIGEFIAPLIRYREIRRSTHLIITEGKAIDFIRENKPFVGVTLSKAKKTAAQESSNTGFFSYTTLDDFYGSLKSTYRQAIVTTGAVNEFENFQEEGPKWGDEFQTGAQYMPGQLPRYGQNKIEYWGTALFNQDKMVYQLNGAQTRMLMMIRGEFARGFFTIQDPIKPELILAIDMRSEKKPKIKISFHEGIPNIDLTIYLKGDFLSIQSMLPYEEEPMLTTLINILEQRLKGQVDDLIDICQDLNIDVFKFGDLAARQFLTIDEWEEYDWNDRFKDAKINTEVEFTLKRTGSQRRSYPTNESGGIK